MTANFNWYGRAMLSLWSGKVNLATDPVYCMLASDTYNPNQDSQQWLSDITGEIIASGYTPGGQQVLGAAAAYVVSGSVKLLVLSGSNMSWPDLTMDASQIRYAILYTVPQGATSSQCPLLGYLNLEQDYNPADQAFYINWHASGIAALQIPVAT